MHHPPKVFISATSGDLRSIRQIVKESLLTINCHPVEQTNFEPDARTVEGMLRGKIADCQALIHIAGLRYGAEPDAATLPSGAPRRSYTQMEYHLGRQLQEERGDERFRVYTFICPEDFPYDAEPDTEPEEARARQRAHRTALFDGAHLYEQPRTKDDLQARVLALQEQVLALLVEQEEVKAEVVKIRRFGVKSFAVLGFLLALVLGGVWWVKKGQDTVIEGQKVIIEGPKITTAGIRKQILLGSERKRDRDLVEADSAEPAKREKLREAALAAYTSRVSRIDEFATSFTELEGRADATAVFKEMARILEQDGVDMAIAYIAEQKGGILDRVRKRKETEQQRTRTELQPLLTAANLKAAAGQTAAARASYREVLALEPAWPDAMFDFAQFLSEQTYHSNHHGTLGDAIADAEESHRLATRLYESHPTKSTTQMLFIVTERQLGDVLVKRGQEGDVDKALATYARSLNLSEVLLKAIPGGLQMMRDVSLCLLPMGDLLAGPGQPGDADKALSYFTRSLDLGEKLLKARPGSVQWTSVAVMSMSRLGNFFDKRGQPGDADKAFDY